MRNGISRAAIAIVVALVLSAATSPQGTTRVEAAGIVVQEVASGLSQPLGVVNAGDGSGRLFIVEQTGLIRIFDGTTILPVEFLDVSDLITDPAAPEQGLLGLAFHPDYENNGFFYINYTDTSGDTVVARYSVSGDEDVADPNSQQVVIEVDQPAANHNGGQLAFGPDGYLYIGLGDGGGAGDPGNNAQDLETPLGKILRLDVTSATPYAVPSTNPLVGLPGLDEIWAYGLRNPWRFSFDRFTGDLFIADVGQHQWEEVNFQPAGATTLSNYGWRVMEGAHCFDPSSGCDMSGKVLPILEYDHDLGCSITGGYRYRGGDVTLNGAYIYGDYCSGRIWSATESGGVWTADPPIDTSILISSFGEDENGELYITGHGDGRLYRITAGESGDTDGDGVPDAADNCPADSNPAQTNSDSGPPPPQGSSGDLGAIGNGPGIPGDDDTVPNGDSLGDICDADNDNDGLPNTLDVNPIPGVGPCAAFANSDDGHPNPSGGDVTNDDDADGNPAAPMGNDAHDDGASWDTDNDGVRDGVECSLGTNPRDSTWKASPALCGGAADADGDGLTAASEACKWGTSDAIGDSDGDGLLDCVEANDTNGDGFQNFPGDTINSARAASGMIGSTMDFDLNGDGFLNFPGDTIASARMASHVGGVCV